jgi:hypothetical protein
MTDETTDDRDNDLWSKANSPFATRSERERALAKLTAASEVDLGEPAASSAETTETWDRSTSPFAPDAARKRAAASEERDKQTTVRSDYGEDDDLTAGQLIDLAETCSIGLTDLLNSISDPEKRKEVENAAIAWGRA